jgi:hypothetical protein
MHHIQLAGSLIHLSSLVGMISTTSHVANMDNKVYMVDKATADNKGLQADTSLGN